jgi:methionine synthase II (cobalamin-independent)
MHHLFNYDIVVQALRDLANVLRAEVEDIKANNIKTITDNFSFKNDLIQYVEAIKDLLSKNPDITKSLSAEQKLTLKNVAQELQESVTLNNSELMKAKYFNDELIKLVVAAVENASTPMKTYDRYGRRPMHSKLKTPTSMTLNKEI